MSSRRATSRFINTLRTAADPETKIRQVHYVGHGAGGGLFFGYHNAVAGADRTAIANLVLSRSDVTDQVKQKKLPYPACSAARVGIL